MRVGEIFSEPVTTYDVYPLNVSRFIHTVGSVNPEDAGAADGTGTAECHVGQARRE